MYYCHPIKLSIHRFECTKNSAKVFAVLVLTNLSRAFNPKLFEHVQV